MAEQNTANGMANQIMIVVNNAVPSFDIPTI